LACDFIREDFSLDSFVLDMWLFVLLFASSVLTLFLNGFCALIVEAFWLFIVLVLLVLVLGPFGMI